MEEFLEVDWWTSIADHNASNTSDVCSDNFFHNLVLNSSCHSFISCQLSKSLVQSHGQNDEDISPFDYGRYYKNGGLYGSLGFLSPTISSALIGAACFTLLTLVFLT